MDTGLNTEIYDRLLHNYLHKLIDERCTVQQKAQLKSLRMCGRNIIKSDAGQTGVFLLSNKTSSRLFGITMCKNPFACPCCSAHRMAIYSAQIGLALEEMESRGYIGFMVTFSIPHLRYMSCREVTDILYNTYSYYRRTMKQKNYEKRVDGTLKNKKGTVAHQFFLDCQIEHSITVCEYTHGKNGWHPHFHALYWTKKENADKILTWEKQLNEFWLQQAKRLTKKYWLEHRTQNEDLINNTLDSLYEKCEKDAGLYISKTNGKLAISKSSDYLCGWGADREVTGNYRKKASANDHRTPYQILEDAYNGDEKSADLYIEFCLAVTRKPVHHRVIWSRTGIKSIVVQAEQVKKAREYLKKNEDENWSVVAWFTCDQWHELCGRHDAPHISNILYLARTRYLLYDYLDGCGIEYELPETHYLTQCVENIFNESLTPNP